MSTADRASTLVPSFAAALLQMSQIQEYAGTLQRTNHSRICLTRLLSVVNTMITAKVTVKSVIYPRPLPSRRGIEVLTSALLKESLGNPSDVRSQTQIAQAKDSVAHCFELILTIPLHGCRFSTAK